jgi:hypothetical protein
MEKMKLPIIDSDLLIIYRWLYSYFISQLYDWVFMIHQTIHKKYLYKYILFNINVHFTKHTLKNDMF